MDVLVAAGLAIDALGALAVVVPDVDPSTRDRVVALTPRLRRFHHAARELPRNNTHTDGTELDQIAILWPALQQFDDTTSSVEIAEMDSITPSGRRSFRVYDADENRLFDGRFPDVREAADRYVDRRLRAWGFTLLAVGFLIQFIGMLVGP